jgi:hypothetical protein
MMLAPRSTFSRDLKRHALNAMLAATSIACAYLICELLFFRFYLPYASLYIRTHLPGTAGVLVQNSKSEFVPRNYIAMLGDSIAEGVGDWLLQADGDRTKPFHSADVIRRITGRDVVSSGRFGAGSAQALVSRPATIFAGTDCYFFPRIEAPQEMVVYFSEATDIGDNDHFLSRVIRNYGNASDNSIDQVLLNEFASVSRWKCRAYLTDTIARMTRFLFQHHLQGISFEAGPERDDAMIVAEEQVPAPRLQGPELAYSDDQVLDAMRVFDRSLAWLRSRFPDVPTTVVYIPSPASIYTFAAEAIATGQGNQPAITASPSQIAVRSDLMCDLLRAATLAHGAAYVDARPALRRTANTRLLHGPIDWSHFNKAGYHVLAEIVVQQFTGTGASVATAQQR